jgi:hypothetical protein
MASFSENIDVRPRPGTTQKSFGGAGAWINGRWHPNGAQAAKTGTEPPAEKTDPAYPGMLEDIASIPVTDPASKTKVEDAKRQLAANAQKTAEAEAKAKAKIAVRAAVHDETKASVKVVTPPAPVFTPASTHVHSDAVVESPRSTPAPTHAPEPERETVVESPKATPVKGRTNG